MNEHEPDPAALDELSRAFGTEHEGVRLIPRDPGPPGDRGGAAGERGGDPALDDTAPTPIDVPGQPPTVPATAPHVITIDAADDIPDPVYVEGSLDAGARRAGRGGDIVVIQDDDSGDALRTETARDLRRGVEPRMRERRAAVQRAKVRKRVLWIGLAVGIVLVIVAALAVLGSNLFAVREDQIRVTGNVYTDPDALAEIVDDLVGTPTLRADTQGIEDRLEQIPWVERAKVTVRFPHSASIELRERRALTTYQGPDRRFRVLDREGRVLDVLEDYPIAYVRIEGPDPIDLEPGQFAPFGYVAASELAMSLTPSLRGRVASIGVTADGAALALLLTDGVEVHFGEARDLLDKLVRLETVLADIAHEQAVAAEAGEPAPEPPAVIDVSTRETTR